MYAYAWVSSGLYSIESAFSRNRMNVRTREDLEINMFFLVFNFSGVNIVTSLYQGMYLKNQVFLNNIIQ